MPQKIALASRDVVQVQNNTTKASAGPVETDRKSAFVAKETGHLHRSLR